jgi:predicted ATPase
MLTEFRVSGYKSLYDCTIPGLMPVNVFHGDNNVGKSNILEALEIFFRAVTIWKAGKSQLDEPLSLGTSEKLIEEWLEKKPLNEWFSWGKQDKEIVLTGVFQQDGQNIRAKVTVWQASASVEVSDPLDLTRALCYRIPARRRLEVEEEREAENNLQPEGANLKERLFWASVSEDPEKRKAFYKVLRPLFADAPLSLGTLQPVAAPEGPYDIQIETDARSIPLEQMGSGVQQLVLMAGLIALSRADLIAIEEPEMNLSWPTQKKLRLIFKEMVEKRETPPSQMFISSHSPLFEFYENFYRVDMNEGRTKVIKAANEERRRLFDRVLPPSDRRAAWLHDENVVSHMQSTGV